MRPALRQIHLKHSPSIMSRSVEPMDFHKTLRRNAKHLEVIWINLEHHLGVL